MRGTLTPLAAVCRRTWLSALRRPVLLTFSLGQPLLWMLFFGFLFQRYPVDAGVRYLDFLAPGISVMTILFGASQAGVGWIRDLQTGILPRMLNAPASPHAILLGKLTADVTRLLLQAAAVLALALLLGARLQPAPSAVLLALVHLALFAAAFSCLSYAISLAARAQEAMASYVHLINMPLLFTSTALVPHRQMPGWLANLARANPLSLAVDAWRGALLEGRPPSLLGWLPLALLLGLAYAAATLQAKSAAARY